MIPLALAGGKQGRIGYVHADGTKPSNDAKLIPEIALLNDCKLYPAGTIAQAAIRQIALRSSTLAPAQWLGQAKPAYLSVSNAPNLYGMTPENSASAQLGLALAIAMYQCQSTARLAIATGELVTRANLSPAGNGSPKDVPVAPVGLIDAKLQTIHRLLDDYKGGAFSASIPFFFPKFTGTGEETLAVHGEDFERVAAAYRERGILLSLHPVSTLREALRILGLKQVKPSFLDRAILTGLAGLVAAGLAGLAMDYWAGRPIAMAFEPIALTTGEALPSPFPARQLADGSVEQLRLCYSADGMPLYTAGSWIVFRVAIENPASWAGNIGRYYFAAIAVSEQSGVKVFPPETWGATPGEREASLRLPIKDVAEANKLIVLARRFRTFDTEELRAQAAAIVAAKPPAERINAAVNALVKAAPGYLDYSFQAVKGDPPCAR